MRSPTQSTVWRTIACDRASKSNIGTRYPLRSAEAVDTVEESPDIAVDRIFQRREAAIVAGALQPIAIALGEVLVAAPNLLGHFDILDIWSGAERVIGRQHHILEAASLAGADVEDPADGRVGHQPHHHPHRVVDIDEIAPLIAIGDALAMRLEQLHGPAGPD